MRITARYTAGGVTRTATKEVTIINGSTSPTLSSLSINGPSSLNEGTSATFVAVATYQDGTSAGVAATWSENSSYASISSDGLLTANMVTSNQTVRITASYTSSGTTLTATKDVTIMNGTASAQPKSITSTSQNRDTLTSYRGSGTAVYQSCGFQYPGGKRSRDALWGPGSPYREYPAALQRPSCAGRKERKLYQPPANPDPGRGTGFLFSGIQPG